MKLVTSDTSSTHLTHFTPLLYFLITDEHTIQVCIQLISLDTCQTLTRITRNTMLKLIRTRSTSLAWKPIILRYQEAYLVKTIQTATIVLAVLAQFSTSLKLKDLLRQT